MTRATYLGVGVMLMALLVLVGCGTQQGGTPKGRAKPEKGGDAADHSHGAGPHGGTISDWGGGKYHVEFTVDHGRQEATVYLFKDDAKTSAPVKTDKLLLSIKEPAFQVELKAVPQEGDAQGASSRFVGKHEKFGKEQEFAGTISGEVEGTPYAADFKEEPEQGHDKK